MGFTHVCMLVLACVVGSHAAIAPMGSYQPATDVTNHAKISIDVVDIGSAMGEDPPDYDAAMNLYTTGKNSPKGEAFRNLQSMAKKDSSSALWEIFNKYYPDASLTWIDAIETAALAGTDYGAKDDFRAQVVKKIPQHLILPLYTFHELDSALGKMADGATTDAVEIPDTDPVYAAAHAWDEGWAFYFGTDNAGAPFGLSESRGGDFDKGTDNVVAQAVQFTAGLDAIKAGNKADATAARHEISRLIKIPLIQAVMKYSWKMDAELNTTKIHKYQGEAFAFYQFLEAQIGMAESTEYFIGEKVGGDEVGAKKLAARYGVSAKATAGNYVEAYCVLDLSMKKWGITWAEIGSLPVDSYAGSEYNLVNCTSRTTEGVIAAASSAPAGPATHFLFALFAAFAFLQM